MQNKCVNCDKSIKICTTRQIDKVGGGGGGQADKLGGPVHRHYPTFKKHFEKEGQASLTFWIIRMVNTKNKNFGILLTCPFR